MSLTPAPDAKILIIDDDPALSELLLKILRADGYRSLINTTDPTRALPLFREHQPDLVLLDLNMSPLDGFEVLDQLRPQIGADDLVPIVVITGEVGGDTKNRALAAGATEFVTKPFDACEILLRARNLLQMRLLHQQLKEQNHLLEEKVSARTAELSETNRELEAGRRHFQAIFENASDAIVLTDQSGHIVSWNHCAQRIFGYSAEEIIGHPWRRLIPERFRASHQAELDHFAQTRQSQIKGQVFQLQGLRHDGQEFPLELSLSCWTTEDGFFFNGIIRDLTDQREEQRQLRQVKDQLHAVLDAMRGAVAWLSSDLKYLGINRLCPPVDETIWMPSQGHAFYDEAGRAVSMTSVGLDITERKEMQTTLSEI